MSARSTQRRRTRRHFGLRCAFGQLGVFDLVGMAALIVLIGGERHVERFAAE